MVTDTTSLSSTSPLKDERRTSMELASKLQHEFFESLVIDSILKCHNTTDREPDILKKEVADITFNDKEAHEVINSNLHEEAIGHDTEQYRKISLKPSNVASEFNLAQVGFLKLYVKSMTEFLYLKDGLLQVDALYAYLTKSYTFVMQGIEQHQQAEDLNKDLRILGEIATLALCIKDGISIEDIKNYVCPKIVPVLELGNMDRVLTTLFDGTVHSYLMREENILHVLRQLDKTTLDKVIAVASLISALPLNKEETLELMLPKELLLQEEKRDVIRSEDTSFQKWDTVSIF